MTSELQDGFVNRLIECGAADKCLALVALEGEPALRSALRERQPAV